MTIVNSDTEETSVRMEKAANPQIVHDFDKVVSEATKNGDADAIVFQLDGQRFVLPAPLDWPDEVIELQAAAANDPGLANPVALAKAYLGEEQYVRFQQAGGNAMRFMRFFEQVMNGTPGESPAS